jgi:hypothetical protein
MQALSTRERGDELLALSLEMAELNGSGGVGGCYLLDKQTIKLHILKRGYISCFEHFFVEK